MERGEVMAEKKKRGNPDIVKNQAWKKSPVIGNNGFDLAPGDNSVALKHAIEMAYIWEPIDLSSDEELQKRIVQYFEYCFENDIRPGVEGMALAIGVDRRTLWNWETERSGTLGNSRSDIIKKAKQILANYMEMLSQDGHIHPVTAIFLMKNHFGYADKSELEFAPKQQLEQKLSPEEIAQRIARND